MAAVPILLFLERKGELQHCTYVLQHHKSMGFLPLQQDLPVTGFHKGLERVWKEAISILALHSLGLCQ